MNEDKATIERRRLLEVWKIKETLLSCNHRDLGIPRKRLEQKRRDGDVASNTYREATSRITAKQIARA